jgi:dTDP-glucose 4,6-dehydratase
LAILVTGGAGFIGSNFVLDWLRLDLGSVVNLDKPPYAGNPKNLPPITCVVHTSSLMACTS